MTFIEAYSIHGPDVERIAFVLNIPRHEADRLINREMNRRYAERKSAPKIRYAGFDWSERARWVS